MTSSVIHSIELTLCLDAIDEIVLSKIHVFVVYLCTVFNSDVGLRKNSVPKPLIVVVVS